MRTYRKRETAEARQRLLQRDYGICTGIRRKGDRYVLLYDPDAFELRCMRSLDPSLAMDD